MVRAVVSLLLDYEPLKNMRESSHDVTKKEEHHVMTLGFFHTLFILEKISISYLTFALVTMTLVTFALVLYCQKYILLVLVL